LCPNKYLKLLLEQDSQKDRSKCGFFNYLTALFDHISNYSVPGVDRAQSSPHLCHIAAVGKKSWRPRGEIAKIGESNDF